MAKMTTCFKSFMVFFTIFVVPNFGIGQNSALFESEEVLELSLKGNVRQLFKNTKGEAQYFDLVLGYADQIGNQHAIPLRVRTRGHFRREMNICDYPPLLLNFSHDNTSNTIFSGQDKLKLVMPCQGEKYVLREYYAYKVYNQLTSKSFKVRMVRLSIVDDSDKPKNYSSLLGFLIEGEEQMAKRNQMTALDKELVKPEIIEFDDFLRMSVFQYLIGNTDWSIQYRQNIKLIIPSENQKPLAVPYDFDHAGIVQAPYAMPAPELKLATVTDRRYRGYCIEEMQLFQPIFAEFKAKKDAIYSVYTESELLDPKSIKSTINYLDEFYTIINNSKRAKGDFQYPCLSGGTGNVVIKGLK